MSDHDPAAIDEEAFAGLEELADGDVEFIGELIAQYLSDARSLAAGIDAASAAGDAEGLQRSAHTLKSASANVGALRLAALCDELQHLGRAADVTGCSDRVAACLEAYARAKRELEQRLEKLGH